MCLQEQTLTGARAIDRTLPAGSVAVPGPLRGSGLQAGVRPDPEPLGQRGAAALVGQQHRGAVHGQLRQMPVVASGERPQPQGSHQRLILLELVRPQVHLPGACLVRQGTQPATKQSLRAQLEASFPGSHSVCRTPKAPWRQSALCTCQSTRGWQHANTCFSEPQRGTAVRDCFRPSMFTIWPHSPASSED
jgi:hypothetical protein